MQIAAETVPQAVQRQHQHTYESTKSTSKKCIDFNVEEQRVKHTFLSVYLFFVCLWLFASCRASDEDFASLLCSTLLVAQVDMY